MDVVVIVVVNVVTIVMKFYGRQQSQLYSY